uniref:GPI ethanolamine phosphate transferase 3 n=1 Tax=Romanomermis culicivorax TaxID=13658 RepID=A0A915JPU1_ROMCU
MKYLLLLCSVVLGYLFGIYFYRIGFLLTRNAILMNSTCIEVQAEISEACWTKASYKRSILIVIDALRYDFLIWHNESSDNWPEGSHFYRNKLASVQEKLQHEPEKTILYKFLADPPTTTLQRLKGLTTGSLPTFIDAGSNFAGSAIEEDNIVDQILKQPGRRLVFLGDDTWTSLFPDRFLRQYAFPSFDTTDLHTVDNGILQYLDEEISNRTDWSVLIAHFLGVDHCGHRYGPAHPEMELKLTQMDIVLSLSSDTILFVLGDHGMTETGDHGGDSLDEISSGLFVYTKRKLHDEKENVRGSVSQIDLVPTLSMLLDFPTPFSNLGAVLTELFPDSAKKLQAAQTNIFQVIRYLEHYLANFNDDNLRDRFLPILRNFYALDPEELTIEKSQQFVHRISKLFVETWAKFHTGWMILGCSTVLETFFWSLSLLIDDNSSISGRRLFLKFIKFSLCFSTIFARNESIPTVITTILLAEILLSFHICYNFICQSMIKMGDWKILIAVFVVFVHGLSQFSNSFIIYDDCLSRFLCASLIWLIFGQNFVDTDEKSKKKSNVWRKLHFKAMVYGISALLIIRMTFLFNRCREEQLECSSSIFTVSFVSLLDTNARKWRIAGSSAVLITLTFLPIKFLQRNGHFQFGETCFSLLLQFGVPFCAISTMFTWFGDQLPHSLDKNFDYFSHFTKLAPFFIYGFLFLSILTFLYNPLMTHVHVLETKFYNPIEAYKYLKDHWNVNKSETQILIYGAATVFSGPIFGQIWVFFWLFLAVLGDGMAVSLLMLFLVIFLALESCQCPHLAVILFAELSTCFYYAFGHQATFTSIPWDAAFLGIQNLDYEIFKNIQLKTIFQAILVIANLSAANVIIVHCLPLVEIWPCFPEKLGFLALSRKSSSPEADCFSHASKNFQWKVFRINLIFVTLQAWKLICIIGASMLHRRHLMYLFIMRLSICFAKFMNNLKMKIS